MEILQLRYFYESAKANSLSETARKFKVPVSSVSASVKRLETELGIALFERTGNRIFLTERGMLFFKTVEQTLTGLEGGIQAVTHAPADEQKLTLLVCSNRKSIAQRIVRFRRLYPSISFKVDLQPQGELGDYDIIIGPENETLTDYDHFEFSRYNVRIEALTSDPLAQRQITLDQLRERSFVTLNRDKQNGGFQALSQACIRHGFIPKIVFECNDYECRDLFLLAGDVLGITLAGNHPSSLPNVQYLEISDFNAQAINYFHYKRTAYTGATKLFVDFIKNY